MTWRRWECEEDDEGEIALWSKDRPSEPATDRECRRLSVPTPETEGKPTLEYSSKLAESQAEDGRGT